MDIGEIKARIAELEQRKAERNAMRGYRDLSYLDYMTKGDRSGFDRIEADEVAYRNMLKQQAQQERMLGLQQDFTARENELNRINAQELAKQNKSQQSEYNLSKARETLGQLAITRDTLKGQGKDYRTVDNQINSLIERYPELQMPESPKYDATKSVDYKLAKYNPINSKSTRSDDIANAIDDLKQFDTPEAAKRIAELEQEYDKRVKYEESAAYVKDLIKAFNVNTGDLDPDLANLGYKSLHGVGGKFKLVNPNGKVVKSYRPKQTQSWD
jgi:hypothetical protein